MTFQLPLTGIKVIDLSVARAGPTAVRQLAEWGATVVRIESAGDVSGVVVDHDSSDYANMHGNKRVIDLDLKCDEGRDIFVRLLADADVLVENFRPPVKRRLRIAYDDLAEQFPTLVYASISGFGQDGPSADKGAVDSVIQGMSGLMSITGTPESGPMRVGIAIADMAAGMVLANGILLALIERHRSGRGQWVQTSLIESLVTFLDFQAVRWTSDHDVPEPVGNEHPTLTPMGTYSAADGYINLAAPSDRLWARLCAAMGAEQLATDPRFDSMERRHRHRDALVTELQALLGTRTRAEWVAALEAEGVPCGPVYSIPEAFDDAQMQHLGMTVDVEHPSLGRLAVLRSPITMSRSRPADKTPSPVRGQDTDDILAELGYSADAISDLRARHVV